MLRPIIACCYPVLVLDCSALFDVELGWLQYRTVHDFFIACGLEQSFVAVPYNVCATGLDTY